MCGISGIITRSTRALERLLLAEPLQAHRGPDDFGSTESHYNGWQVATAHRRLSIIDLSPAGHQPFKSCQSSGGWLCYNGELYNYKEIREELKSAGITFDTDCDTEVLLKSLEQYGLEAALKKFNGMFSFAWLDEKNGVLYLVRDRVGIKPLHYCLRGGELLFSSEIKPILEMSGSKFDLNLKAVSNFLKQSLLNSSDETFFEGINAIPAGSFCQIDLNSAEIKPKFTSYWQPPLEVLHGNSANQAEELEQLLFDSVQLRLRADTPVGILLSGGIDSASITAAVRKHLGQGVELNLFTAVSDNKLYDESSYAKKMAESVGSKLNTLRLDFKASEAIPLLQRAIDCNEQPVGSFSNVAHYLLLKMSKDSGVPVILSGQGADELLCGYRRYYLFYIQQLAANGRLIKAGAELLAGVRQNTIFNRFNLREAKRYMPSFLRRNLPNYYGDSLLGLCSTPLTLSGKTVQQRQKIDLQNLSVPSLLHYEDRMSMAHGREVRLPFLDHRLIEFLLPMSLEQKMKNGWSKHILRRAMNKHLPAEITWRREKMGFTNPEAAWLRSNLVVEVQQIFGENSLIFQAGLLKRKQLLERYKQYVKEPESGGSIWHREIFNPLSLELFLRSYKKYLNI